jgi:hypothetical protein
MAVEIQNNHVPHVWYVDASLDQQLQTLCRVCSIYASVTNLFDQSHPVRVSACTPNSAQRSLRVFPTIVSGAISESVHVWRWALNERASGGCWIQFSVRLTLPSSIDPAKGLTCTNSFEGGAEAGRAYDPDVDGAACKSPAGVSS